MSISLFMRRRATIWRARDLAGGARGPAGRRVGEVVEVEVRLGSEVVGRVRVGVGEGDWGGGVVVFMSSSSSSSLLSSLGGRGGRGAGRWGLRYVAVEIERFLVVLSGNGTGLSSMGGGRMGAPGKSTL